MADASMISDPCFGKKRKASTILPEMRSHPAPSHAASQTVAHHTDAPGTQPLPYGLSCPPSYQDSLSLAPYLQHPQPLRPQICPFSWDPDLSRGTVESPPVSPLSQPLPKAQLLRGTELGAFARQNLSHPSCYYSNTAAFNHNTKVETLSSSSDQQLGEDASSSTLTFDSSDSSPPSESTVPDPKPTTANGPPFPQPGAYPRTQQRDGVSHSMASTAYTPNAADLVTRQLELFTSLEDACTNAATTYWRGQCESAFDLPPGARVRYRRHPPVRAAPYAVPDRSRPTHIYSDVHPSAAHPTQHRSAGAADLPAEPTLKDFIHAISDNIWRRASRRDSSPSAQLEAVHRIGNLYAWTEHVVSAARGEFGLARRETVFTVVMAARDLCTWMLDEAGKRRIEALWEGAWAVAAE